MEEIRGLKLAQRVHEIYPELRKQANPKLLLRNENRQEDLERAVVPEIRGQVPPAAAPDKIGG